MNISQHAAIMWPLRDAGDSALYPNDKKYYGSNSILTSSSAAIHSTPRRNLSATYGGPLNSFLYLSPGSGYGTLYLVRKWKNNGTSTQSNGFSGFSAALDGQRIYTGIEDGIIYSYNPLDSFDELGLILWQEPESEASSSKLLRNDSGI